MGFFISTNKPTNLAIVDWIDHESADFCHFANSKNYTNLVFEKRPNALQLRPSLRPRWRRTQARVFWLPGGRVTNELFVFDILGGQSDAYSHFWPHSFLTIFEIWHVLPKLETRFPTFETNYLDFEFSNDFLVLYQCFSLCNRTSAHFLGFILQDLSSLFVSFCWKAPSKFKWRKYWNYDFVLFEFIGYNSVTFHLEFDGVEHFAP